ncbi:integrator complex subunit 10 [Rhincodon typus]|uniref:integrator complex subunit 10 n=1 Tax=Rhincodon typus TaxID=259920 RepID=UPI00202E7AF6|nr:integrator complex subunit 10 [Rhincodon typus]
MSGLVRLRTGTVLGGGIMAAQVDCEFLVKKARDLVAEDPWAAKAWLITARTLYPTDFGIQYEMYMIERNAERTASAGRLLYDMFVNFPDQPMVWREINVITAALRNDTQDKQTQFLRGLFETLPGRIQCEMLLKATEQCFNTLERAEMLLLLLRRFPESVVQHGVSLGETLLEAENLDDQDSPVNCFRKLFVCDVLPLIINNPDVRLPANLLYQYLHKAAEFYIGYITRSPSLEGQHQGSQDTADIKSPTKRSTQKYIIEGLTEKSSLIMEPWDRLFEIMSVVAMRCEWQMDKANRNCGEILHRMKDLCRYINNFDDEGHRKYKHQVVYSTLLIFFKNAFQYVSSIQPSLFQASSPSSNQIPLILLDDLSNIYGDVDIDRSKHIHKRRKLGEGREKTLVNSVHTTGKLVLNQWWQNSSPPLGVLPQEFKLQPSSQTADRHHTVTRGITKGVKEDFRLAMERQVSRCGENLMVVLHRFCINEKIILLQTLM